MNTIVLVPPSAPEVAQFLRLLRGEETSTLAQGQTEAGTLYRLADIPLQAGEDTLAALLFTTADQVAVVEWVALPSADQQPFPLRLLPVQRLPQPATAFPTPGVG